MSNLSIKGVRNLNDYDELVRMFFPDGSCSVGEVCIPNNLIEPDEKKDEIKRILYQKLEEMTGRTLKWGTLTGVKPLKLYNKLLDQNNGNINSVKRILKNEYLISDRKMDLLSNIHKVQKESLPSPEKNEISVYIGIPFCPTKCTYCSFTSNQKDYEEVKRYLDALYKEIKFVSHIMNSKNLIAESVYIGGGTPTTLDLYELEQLVTVINEFIPAKKGFEFTVEAGRPDTITAAKLSFLFKSGVTRISINPQTMKEETLGLIGRNHNTQQVKEAFVIASEIGFEAINADIIAGLPGETADDFERTLNELIPFAPANITIHTLALKKSSKLMEKFHDNNEYPFDNKSAKNMVNLGEKYLTVSGYRPYYIYRQKYMADNLENVGYAKKDTECIYNMRIMEEKQTVLAMGAGASSKIYYPGEDRIERVINVSNYEIYIDRIDEMIDRKRKKFF